MRPLLFMRLAEERERAVFRTLEKCFEKKGEVSFYLRAAFRGSRVFGFCAAV